MKVMQCVMVILNYRDSERAIKLADRCKYFSVIDKIVIVDNDSMDGSYERLRVLESEKIDVLKAEKNGGFSAGNNVGARYAMEKYAPKYIFFANTDTIFEEDKVIACLQALEENSSLGLVSMRMVGPDNKEQNASYQYPTYSSYLKGFFWIGRRCYYNAVMSRKEYKSSIEYVDIIRGSFMFFRANALKQAGYFDENTFLYCEELIISWRLRAIGYMVGLLTDKYYIHDHIEVPTNQSLTATKRLYDSRYYFAVNYWKIGYAKRVLMKILEKYSIFEMRIIDSIKYLSRGGRK